MSDPLTTTIDLVVGSVVQVAVDKSKWQRWDGQGSRWWKRFVYVRSIINRHEIDGVTLKLVLDHKCFRFVDVTEDVVTTMPEHAIPQGVSAMLMKHLATGAINGDGTAF